MTLQINIDNGGTLTDICILTNQGAQKTKVLTTPYDLSKCFFEGLQKASGVLYGETNVARLLEEADLIRYSTTQGTNAICERKGPKLGLITDEGSADLAGALRQHDEQVYDALVADRIALLDLNHSDSEVTEVEIVKAINRLTATGANRVVVSFGGKDFAEKEALVRSVVLRKYPRHLLGAVPVLYGSDLSADGDAVRRSWTALINSFLHPAMEHFLFNAENRLRDYKTKNPLLIFRNDGDASRVAKTVAVKTYSSGPRGGMEGMKAFAKRYGLNDVVAVDVGGTTTDIGQCLNGEVKEVRNGHVEGIRVSFPLSQISSAGAGGSSIFKVADQHIVIGPESVGAVPGPAAFGRGGEQATITDASVLAGVLNPASYFGGGLSLDLERARNAVQTHIATPLGLSLDEALQAMEAAYEQKIAQEVQRFTKVTSETVLLAFGGAGPLNACGVAEHAGIKRVAVPAMAAVFSAYGIGSCDISQRYTVALQPAQRSKHGLSDVLAEQLVRARRDMFAEGFEPGQYEVQVRLVGISAEGDEHSIALDPDALNFPSALSNLPVVELEVAAIKRLRQQDANTARFDRKQVAKATGTRNILTRHHGRQDVPVYRLADLQPGDFAEGPAILEEDFFTCRVRDGWSFAISAHQDILLTKKD